MAKSSRILIHFRRLLDSGLYSDFKLVVGCEEIAVHRCVLAVRSPFFAKVLRDADSQEVITGSHKIQDIDFNIVRCMVEFIYSGHLKDHSIDVVLQLYRVSHIYEMNDMRYVCIKCMKLDVHNVCDVLEAEKLCEAKCLMKKATNFIFVNIKKVQKTEKWNNFFKRHSRFVLSLYEEYVLNVENSRSSCDIFGNLPSFWFESVNSTRGPLVGQPEMHLPANQILRMVPPSQMNLTDTVSGTVNTTVSCVAGKLPIILDHFRGLLDSGLHTDFKLMVGCKELAVHRCVLAARSPVFATMLQQEMKEAITGILEIEDTDFDVVRQMTEFLYSGQLNNLSPNVALQLYCISKKYQIDDMKDMCVKYLEANLQVDNVCDVLAVGNLYNETCILQEAKKFVFRNIIEIQKTVKWNELHDKDPELVFTMYKEYVDKIV